MSGVEIKNGEVICRSRLSWFENYPRDFADIVRLIVEQESVKDYLEIGGNTHRSLDDDTLIRNLDSVSVLDIDEQELQNVPLGSFHTYKMDICGDVSSLAEGYDVVVSKFCAEHVKDGSLFHRNVASLLRKQGRAVHVFPTLWSLPFLLNLLFSERLSMLLVKYFQPWRFNAPTAGKFPAYYSLCRGGQIYYEKRLLGLGFRKVQVLTYFGHRYFERIPGLSFVDKIMNRLFLRFGWVWFSSYCIVIATK